VRTAAGNAVAARGVEVTKSGGSGDGEGV